MATLYTVGIEVQASAAQQAIARMEKAFERLSGSSRDLNKSTQLLNREFDKAAKGVAGVSKATDEMSQSAEKASNNLTTMRVALGNIIADAVVGGVKSLANQIQQLGANVIRTGAQAEKTAVAFETFLGSAKEAKKVMKEVRDFAATTPFELPEVTNAAKQLLATRTPANELIETIARLGEIAAGADKPLSQLLFIYTQVKNQGRATGEDINQLLNAGLSMEDIARALGKTAKELGQMKGSSQGLQLTFEEVDKVLRSVTSEGGRFAGLMDKLGTTTAVKLSNLNDAFTKIYQSIYDGISPAISGVLDVIVGILDPLGENKTLWAEVNAQALDFKTYLEQNPDIIKTISNGLEEGINVGLKAASDLAKGLLGYLEDNPDAIAKAVEQVDLLIKGLARAYEIIALSVEGWQKIVALGQIFSGGDRITPTSGAERILAAGGSNADAQGFQDEVTRRMRNLPFWDVFNNAKKEEIVREVFEDVLGRVKQQQAKLNQATTDPPPVRKDTEKAITAEVEKQAEALKEELAKKRQLADLEVQRLQQRLDLEKAYGKISQEEILRREAAIRLRRNELALANLALEKALQEQLVKEGKASTPKDFSVQEQALREENTFIQQRLQADTERLNRELRQQESDQRMKAENELFNLRKQHEMEVFRLQREGIQLLQERQLRGRNETEKTVLKLNQEIENAKAASEIERMRYLQSYNADIQEKNSIETQLNRLFELYKDTGAPPEVYREFEALKARDLLLVERINNRNREEGLRLTNEQVKLEQLFENRDNVFINRMQEVLMRLDEDKYPLEMERRLIAAPSGARVEMRAGMAFDQLYGGPKE